MAKSSGTTRNARPLTGAKQSGGEALTKRSATPKQEAQPKVKTSEERIVEAASSPEKHLEYISDYMKAVDEPLQKLRKIDLQRDTIEAMSLIEKIDAVSKDYNLMKESQQYRKVQDREDLTLEERHYRFGETYDQEHAMKKVLVNALRRAKNKAKVNYFGYSMQNDLYSMAKIALYHIGSK